MLRKGLGKDWRFTSREQLLQMDGIGAKVATKIHAALVAAAWQVEVLPEPPEGLDMSAPVMAKPGGEEAAKAAEKADEKAARAAAKAARRAAAKVEAAEKAEKVADAAETEAETAEKAAVKAAAKVASGLKRKEKAREAASPDAEGTASTKKKRRSSISSSDRNPSELTEAQRAIEVGSAVRVCAGPHEGQEGTVTSVLKAWLHVTVRDGSTANVRRVQLQPLADLAGAPAGDEDDTNCVKCGQPTTAFNRLLCDGPSCGIVMHYSCCEPPLDAVPEKDWFCPDCIRSSAAAASVGAAEGAEERPFVLADEQEELMDVSTSEPGV